MNILISFLCMYLIYFTVLYIVRCDDHDQEPEIARIFDLEEKGGKWRHFLINSTHFKVS